jgi:hypothetical protein
MAQTLADLISVERARKKGYIIRVAGKAAAKDSLARLLGLPVWWYRREHEAREALTRWGNAYGITLPACRTLQKVNSMANAGSRSDA